MRELKIGEQIVRVRATPLALLFYKQEFRSDLLGDLLGMVKLLGGAAALNQQSVDAEKFDFSQFDSIAFLQLIWAMAKADAYGQGPFPSFIDWVAKLDSFDLTDAAVLTAALEEAASGFFRAGVKPGAAKS